MSVMTRVPRVADLRKHLICPGSYRTEIIEGGEAHLPQWDCGSNSVSAPALLWAWIAVIAGETLARRV